MRHLKFIFLPLFLFGLTSNAHTYSNDWINTSDWEHLGTRKVNYKNDRDEIPVTIRDGKFKRIKLTADKGDINIHQCIVTFADGTKQIINIRKRIKAGSSTRVIDIMRGSRVIRKVAFIYDTKGIKTKKGKIKLYGLR